jgi:hypothetical protein
MDLLITSVIGENIILMFENFRDDLIRLSVLILALNLGSIYYNFLA